ncbi:MAG: FAD-binding oxidoreductase [Nocardioides sp.]|uniref:FAD-binding oxidoreductase n=1 Tax=Nocardioides sp. TaxID=35761 RepID=UPI0039E53566
MKLIDRESEDFEAARVDRIFNRRLVDRQPTALVRPTTEDEIVAAVRLARTRGWQIAVRSGGHSWAQWSVRDDALVVDLGDYHELAYDEATAVVVVSPSTKGGAELAPYLAERGRFFVGGHCPTVGIGGFLLQGGQGWNARGWGWAAEYVMALDVVTAAGELLHCSAEENADLYWAARGAGPGFPGVVTRFHLQTLPLPRHVAHSVQGFHLDDFDAVMTWLHDLHATVADTVEIVALTKTDLQVAPGPILLVTALALVGDEAEAETALAPFRTNPVLDRAILTVDNEPTTFEAERGRQVEDNPEGHRWVVDNAWLSGTAEEVIPAMRRAYTTLPNQKAFTIWFSMAPLRGLPDMAFSVQSEIYLAAYVCWESPDDDDRCVSWLEGAMADLEPVTVGQYLGDSDLTRRQVRFMSDEAWERLQKVCAERDPDGVFVGYLAGPDGAANANHWE